MINADSLARARALLVKSLTDTCLIERETSARGSYGEPTHAWETVSASVACRVLPAGEGTTTETVASGDRETLTEEYRLIVPRGTTLAADYRVTVDSVQYLVVRVEQALSDDVMVEALVVRNNG